MTEGESAILKKQTFQIITHPKGQGRAKFARAGNYTVVYDPATSRDYKADIKYQILQQNPQMMTGGIAMSVEFTLARPKSHYNKKGLKGTAPYWCTNKPDLDNLVKAVMDAITSTGKVWQDDKQVCSMYQGKKYGDPGILITLTEVE